MKLQDLNCDLGEGESTARTRALMRWIHSANIACGGHAGDTVGMERCVQIALKAGVRIGAHPGPWNRKNQGRDVVRPTPKEFELLLVHQVGALETIAIRSGARLHHIKLHGGLYHASERSDSLAQTYVATVKRWWPATRIFARAGGRVARIARGQGLRVWEEAFADRGYRADGTLVPRHHPRALVTDPGVAAERVHAIARHGTVRTISGKPLAIRAQTICVHSDTPNAIAIAKRVRALL